MVDFSTFDGTALAGLDYVSVDGSAFFNPGTASLTVLVPLLDDTDVEDSDEDFTLEITGTDNAEFDGSSSVGTATFGAEAGLSIGDIAVSEAAATATFTVSRTSSLDVTATVDFATANGTATAGSDFTANSGTLTFAAGVTSQTVTVSLIDDEIEESAELFSVELSNATNAELVDDSGAATITDDDSGGGGGSATTLSIGNGSGSENPGNAMFTVTRGGDTTGTTTVQFATTGVTATAGADFTVTSGTRTFAPGVTTQTVTVPVLADGLYEPVERFNLTLSNPSGGATLSVAVGEGTIANNIVTSALEISDLIDGTKGFVINGPAANVQSGKNAISAGDINGDGFTDVIIGVPYADPPPPPARTLGRATWCLADRPSVQAGA